MSATIKFLGWNVRFQSSVTDIVGHINSIKKDQGDIEIICLQEVPSYKLSDPEKEIQEIAKALDMKYHFAISSRAFRTRFRGKEKAIHHELAILSKYPFIEGSKHTFNLRESIRPNRILRKLITAQLKIPNTSKPLTVGDFHMSPYDFLRRMIEAKTLSKLLQECDIAFGDANSQPNSRYIKHIIETHPRIDDNTHEHTFFTRIGPYKFGPFQFDRMYSSRLDYVVGKVQTENAKILDHGPSDHKPLLVNVKL